MSEEVKEKQTKDFSEEIKTKIPELIAPVKKDPSKLQEALDNLLAYEKKTRLAADIHSTCELSKAIIALCKDNNEWKLVNEYIQLLCKRRAQLGKVVLTVVREGMAIVVLCPEDKKGELIETLRTVSAGKIEVELERARLTKQLCDMKEAQGDLAGAAEILGDITVETVGSMEIEEKAKFLLEQLRLWLLNKDYVRAEIISKKITAATLDKEELQDLKLSYYKLMIELHLQNKNYMEITKAYEKMFHTKKVQDDEKLWKDIWTNAITFASLSQFDSEVSDILERFKIQEKTAQLPVYAQLLKDLTTIELMDWPLPGETDIKKLSIFTGEHGDSRWKELHKRIVQHNIRVISTYYTRITTNRLAELLKLDVDATEENLSEMTNNKQVFVKIDRCAGTMNFQKKQTPHQILNEWGSDISSLLSLVDKTCHLIHKENMMHGLKA